MNIVHKTIWSIVSLAAGLLMLYSPQYLGLSHPIPFVAYTVIFAFVFSWCATRRLSDPWWLWPVLFTLAYPAKVFLEIVVDPKSHGLWPIEIVACLPYLAVGLLAGYLSRRFA